MNAKMKKFLSVLLAASMTLGSISSLSTAVTANELTDQTETSSQQDEAVSYDDSQNNSDSTAVESSIDDASTEGENDLTDSSQTEEGTDSSAANYANSDESTENSSASQPSSTVSESGSAAYDSLSAVQLDENGNILYVRASADQGVLPEGSTFTAKLADTAEEKEKADSAVSAVRKTDELLADSYLLDLTFQDAEGNVIEPNGEVTLTLGLVDTGSLSENASSAVKAALSEQIMTKVEASVTVSDEEALKEQTAQALEEQSISYQLSDLSLSLYHLTSNADLSLSASKVELKDKDSDSEMTNAGLIYSGKVSSFSQYQIELVKKDSYAQTVNEISKALISAFSPAVVEEENNEDGGLAFLYRIQNSDTVNISTIVSGLQESAGFPSDIKIISGSCSDSNVTVNGSGLSRSFTVPVGGDSYAITLYDEDGNFYSVNLYSDLPKVSTADSTSFTINWNDNGGNDEANLVKRPSWSDIRNLYEIQYSIDGGEYQTLSADSLSAYGLDSIPTLDPDTDSSLTTWAFTLENLPSSYTENLGDGKQTHSISYAIKQTSVPEGYVSDGSTSLIEMNASITNTVQVAYQANIVWKDNNNAYTTRPVRNDIDKLLANGTIKLMRYVANTSAKPIDITDSITSANFAFVDNEDGSVSISLVNLPSYCAEEDNYGAPYIYSIILNPQVNPDASTSGDAYIGSYSNVDNYASYTGALYNGGTLTELLSNTIDFSYSKTWSDNNNNNRPDAYFYFYVATEDDVTSGSFNTNKASAVAGYSTVNVEKEDGTYTVCTDLPKYNDQGQRLVYFAIEKGLSGDYISAVNNASGDASQDVINVFDAIKGSYLDRDNGVYYPKYLLNGGSIDNKLSATTKAEVSKTINASAMQEMNGAEVNFVLQKMVSQTAEDGSISYQWVNASQGDLDGHDNSESGDVTLTLDGFRAESMTQTGSSPDLKKYNEAGESIIYRWKEVSVSLNGSETKELTWDESNVSPDSMTYETAEAVSIGKYAPGIGGEMVDFYLTGESTTVVNGNGSSQTTISNDINAPYLLKIDKTWSVNGENVTSKLPDTAYAIFEVYDADGNVVKDEEGNPIQITLNAASLSQDGSKWEMIYKDLERFDEEGREYTYSIKEIKLSDGGYLNGQGESGKWSKETTYSMAVAPTNAEGKADETAKELIANVSNYYVDGPGNSVYLAAQKIWKDDGDLISRKPVTVGIYYIGEDGYGLVDTMTLTDSGLWYKKAHISSGTSYYHYADGQWTAAGTLPETITQDDFLIVELGTGDTEAVTVSDAEGKTDKTIYFPSSVTTLAEMNFAGNVDDDISLNPQNWRNYLEWSEEDLSALKNSISSSDTELGLLADDTYDTEGDSNYTYSINERTGYIGYAEMDGYIITDTRIGKLNLDLIKTWADGGENRTGHFALYQNGSDTPVFEFDLGVNHDVNPLGKVISFVENSIEDIFGISLDSSSSSGSITGLRGASYQITANTEVNKQTNLDEVTSYEIQLKHLPKYDENGVLISYSLKETAIYDDSGDAVEIKNGSATVDGLTYSSSCSLDTSKGENGTVYGKLHHTNDWTYWRASNSLTGSYNLNFYKVWYDDADETDQRPNIYFDIYRMSTNVWINNNRYTLKDWLESDSLWKETSSLGTFSTQEAAFSSLFSKYYSNSATWSQIAEKVTTITADRYYDAAGNKYLWSIDVGSVAQYDEDGYPYIYFAIENGISKDSAYYGNEFYGNMSWDALHVNTSDSATAKETYDYYSYSNYKEHESNSLLVLSDGVHSRNGDAGAYYSRTIVNEKQESRTISGRKIWNTIPFSVDTDDLPTVKMALYRSTTPINKDQDLSEYTHSQMEEWIKDSSAEEVAEFTLHDTTAGDYSFTGYTYRIKYEDLDHDGEADTHTVYDADGNEKTVKTELAKYDPYGNVYYYYAIELGDKDGKQIEGYQENPTYNAAYFYLTNTYDVTKQPYVKIQVGKNWTISDEALNENPALTVKDLSPVDITLYAVMQDENGNPIGKAVEMQTITYDPAAEDTSAYDSFTIDEESGSIYASFSKFEAANSTIPYYAPNGRPFLFYVTESSVKGYDSTITIGDKSYPASDQTDAEKRHYINLELNEKDSTYYNAKDETLAFNNTYTGEPTISFNPVKKWADAYVDNSAYRPAKIRLTISRSANDKVDKSWSRSITFSKTTSNASATEWTVDNSDPSSDEVDALKNLPKYDTAGNTYRYYISKEEFLDESDQLIGTANAANDLIGDYQMIEQNTDNIKNKLNNSVTIQLNKNWYYQITNASTSDAGEKSFTYDQFIKLREMNALPLKMKFVVERSTDGQNWSKVKASEIDSDHKITLDESDVIGYEVDLNSITEDTFASLFNTKVKWENLPAATVNGSDYQYRVSEILTWKNLDGSEVDISYNNGDEAYGVKSTITSSTFTAQDENGSKTTSYTITAKNLLKTRRARLAKEWIDNGGRDHTRPASLDMTISSKNGSHTYTLNTSDDAEADIKYDADGNITSSTYYSDYFLLPDWFSDADLENYFDVSEGKITIAEYEASDVAWSKIEERDGSISYIAKITNTLKDDRKTITLSVRKKWNDKADWEATLRPTMKFTLQYLKQGGNKNNNSDWISMTNSGDSNIANFTLIPKDDDYTPQASYEVTKDATLQDWMYWKYLKKYWDTPSIDGKSELISYRVIEERADGQAISNSSYVCNGGNVLSKNPLVYGYTFNIEDGQSPAAGTIENKIEYKKISIKKAWQEQSSQKAIDNNKIAELVNLKALPEYIRFHITYQDSKGTEYTFEQTNLEIDLKVTDLANATADTSVSLPRYDQYGGEIQYTISEYQIKYKGGDWQDANSSGLSFETKSNIKTGSTGTTVTFTNTLSTTERSLTKSFIDENNRDGLQGDVKIQLYRDGETYGDPITLNAANNWSYTWTLLPLYQNDVNGSYSDYTYKEVSINGKAVSDSGYHYLFDLKVDGDSTSGKFSWDDANNTGSANLTNIHSPYRGTITASKSWDDLSNYYGSEAKVYLALQYKNPTTNNWEFVKANASFDENGQYVCASGETTPIAYTSSALVQSVSNASEKASWDNLPVNYNNNGRSSKLTYRVVEVTAETKDSTNPTVKDSNTIDGYTVNYPEASFAKNNQDNQKLSLTVKNTLVKQTASISKIWSNEGSWADAVRPDSLLIKVNWTHGSQSGSGLLLSDGTTTAVGTENNPITLNNSNNWKSSDFYLPLYDMDGNAYSYTITEQYKFGNAVINKSGYNMDLSITNANSKWQISKVSGSENTWTLSLKDTTSEATDNKLSLTASNSLIYGNLTVSKIWNDDQNREANRKDITVQLYRDGVALGSEIELTPANNWSYTWDKLPVYKQNGSDKSNYTIKETNAESDWNVTYSPATAEYSETTAASSGIDLNENQTSSASITNTISPNYFTVSASKAWEDANDRYNVSASYLYVKLQYSTDQSNWSDVEHADSKDAYANSYADGSKVYTTSSLIQKIQIQKIGNVRTSSIVNWENLPEKVRTTSDPTGGSSATVYYRVVECNSPTEGEAASDINAHYNQSSTIVSYNSASSDAGSVKKASITLTNSLPMGSLSVKKFWNDSDSSLRPDKVEVKLYRKMDPNDDSSWSLLETQELVKASAVSDPWTYTWENLPLKDKNGNLIQYKVEEASTINGYTVSYQTSTGSWVDSPVALTLTEDQTVTSMIKNTQANGSISVDKIWSDDSGLESERPTSITYELYRSDNLSRPYKTQTVAVGPDGSASYTWNNLPVYNKDGSAFTYKVVEQAVNGYESSYSSSYPSSAIVPDNNSVTLDNSSSSASITVTNTLKTAQLRVIKKWLDEDDRDQIRPAAEENAGISVQLYRDGKKYGNPVTIYQQASGDANTWAYEWTNLPYYQTGSASTPSVYYVEETSVDGYTCIYNDGSADYSDASQSKVSLIPDTTQELIIKNIHTPKKTSLTAAKVWDDQSDLFSKRPSSIYLTLMYQIDGSDDWGLVTQAEAVSASGEDIRYADGGVHTTSKVIQEVQSSYEQNGNRQTASWENLPQTVLVNGVSKKISYQVFETDAEGNAVGKSANGYRVSYDSASGDASGDADSSQTITNKLMTTSMTISKSWKGDESWGDITRPSKITFLVEYSLDGGESWTAYSQTGEDAICIDGYVSMSGDSQGAWQDIVLNDLPLITEDGTYYQYRVSEYSVELNGQTILCLNQDAASKDDTLTGDAEEGTEETRKICSRAGAYDAEITTKQNDNETWSVTAINSLATGSISVSKTWADGNDRDGLRPGSIDLELHRIDKIGDKEYDEVIDTITIEAENDGSWPTYTWEHLPIYSRDGSGKASYYVKETDTDHYSSSYEAVTEKVQSSILDAAGNVLDTLADLTGLDLLQIKTGGKTDQAISSAADAASTISADATAAIKVTNTHEVNTFTVTASKIWDDNANARGLRDSSVSFTLQYSLDQGKTWQNVSKLEESEIPDAAEDQGTKVWTSSDVTQTISGKMTDSEWTGFRWENLPAHALDANGKSVEVQYRVTEELSKNTSANYTVTEGSILTYGKSEDKIASTSITNTVKPEDPVNPTTPDNNNPKDSAKTDSTTNTGSTSKNVKTGDDSQYILWALLMTGAFVSMLYTGARYKRKKKED